MKLLTILLSVAISGFAYDAAVIAPSGDEWQSPTQLSLNKQLPHAWFFSFQDEDAARRVLPENSSLWKSLDGNWKFNWVSNPEERPLDFFKSDYDDSSWDLIPVPSNWNIVGIQKDGSQKYGTPIYVNVRVPFFYQREVGDWKEGVMRTPPTDWTMCAARNEVGSYRTRFTVPADWSDKRVYLNFNGVDSFFYLWVNGKYVGFSKNSRNVAQFDITSFLKDGENLLAVEVYRNSDGSQLEAQDMFRLPGIFRTVALEAKPQECVRDIRVTPSMNSLKVEAQIAGSACSIDYSLYENELYSPENRLVAEFPSQGPECILKYAGAKPWSAEAPHLYVLVGKLRDAEGAVKDIFSVNVGFRIVEIKDTPASEDEFGKAGRYFFCNGKAFKLRGVNRHETEPERGHAITRESMFKDVMLLKRANINHVRNSHYPDDPYWYYLCDMYGIYLMDEANNESHHYGYDESSLSHVPEFRDAFVARMTEMIVQNYNHPSIVVWSSGNECGPGVNFKAVYDAGKALDPMRPVQYERNNDYSDFGCRQYPAVEWVANTASGTANEKYPYHINEFAHSMGNAMGDFEDYWKLIDGTNFITGACVWDWVDQSLYNWTKDGIRYLASGGNFGDYPNDGQFVMNGVLFGDRTPKPQYQELKKVYQNIYTALTGDSKIEIFNRNYYEPVGYLAKWSVIADGKRVADGEFETGQIPPRTRIQLPVPDAELPEGKECFINIEYCLTENLPWADAGYVQAKEQLLLQKGDIRQPDFAGRAPKVKEGKDGQIVVRGRGFKAVFDKGNGTLQSLRYGCRNVICPGEGPRLNLFRACTNNDGWAFWSWFRNGLDNLKVSMVGSSVSFEDGCVKLDFEQTYKADNGARLRGSLSAVLASDSLYVEDHPEWTDVAEYRTHITWYVYNDGRIKFESDIDTDKPEVKPARIGFVMKIPARLADFSYYGRGPEENYVDRCSASFLGIYKSKVSDNLTDYTKSQECGNHEQVRWARLTGGLLGRGIEIVPVENSWNTGASGQAVMSVSALQYSAKDLLFAQHRYELPEPGDTYLCIDAAVVGLGGNSCGPKPQEKNVFDAKGHFSFVIRPVRSARRSLR